MISTDLFASAFLAATIMLYWLTWRETNNMFEGCAPPPRSVAVVDSASRDVIQGAASDNEKQLQALVGVLRSRLDHVNARRGALSRSGGHDKGQMHIPPAEKRLIHFRRKPFVSLDDVNSRESDVSEVTRGLTTMVYSSENGLEKIEEERIFARNTIDKLRYQLDNLGPARHCFSRPQWNPPRMMDQPPSKPGAPRKNLFVGISTVNRQTNYLFRTVKDFIAKLSQAERTETVIVVFNANVPPNQHKDIPIVRQEFQREIEEGLLEIIERPHPADSHPQLANPANLTVRWGDDLARVEWRGKQVLDVAYLMDYATKNNRGFGYFLMMEDDIIAARNYPTKIRNYVDNWLFSRTDWMMTSFYNPWPDVHEGDELPPYKFFGVIGQLFRIHDLPVVVEFLRKNFDQSPLDWLFVDFLKKYQAKVIMHSCLFQHKGTVSSLPGKEQSGSCFGFVE